jgi:hypothetical protein
MIVLECCLIWYTLPITYTHLKNMLTRLEHKKISSSVKVQRVQQVQPANAARYFCYIYFYFSLNVYFYSSFKISHI